MLTHALITLVLEGRRAYRKARAGAADIAVSVCSRHRSARAAQKLRTV